MTRFWTVRNRFLIFGLLSLLPFIGLNWLLLSENQRVRYNDMVANEATISSQVQSSLSGFLNSEFRALDNLATNPVVVAGQDHEAINNLLGQSRTFRTTQAGLFMLDADGQIIGESGIESGSILPNIENQVSSVLTTGQRAITGRIDLNLDAPTSVFVVLVPVVTVTPSNSNPLSTPVADNAMQQSEPNGTANTSNGTGTLPAGTVLGVVGSVIPVDSLAQNVLPTTRGRTDIVVLTDTQIIAATGDIRANEANYLANLHSQTNVFPDAASDVFEYRSITGTERVATWSTLPLESANWTVLVTSPTPSSQIQTMWEQLLALALVAALVYLAVAFTFGELISRSLTDLTSGARRLATGDYQTPITRQGSGEIAALSDSLATLRQRTQEMMTGAAAGQSQRQRQTEQLRELLRRDLKLQEDERRHIASEIHDAVSPLITGALYQSRALQMANGGATPELVQTSLDDVNQLLERASNELHGIIFDLRPPDLDDIGVVAAIEAFVATIQRTGLECRLEVIDEPPPLTPEVRLGIYRIVQEALHNVLRHAGADEAVVRMEYLNQMLRVTIRDNGAGFDPEKGRRPTSLGLLSMRERAAAIDADFEIISRPGGGTVIILERRDTGTIMSDELLTDLLRGRIGKDVASPEETADNTINDPVEVHDPAD